MITSLILTAFLQTTVADTPPPECGSNEEARELAMLILSHNSQMRAEMHCNALLTELAAQRAIDLSDGSEEGDLTPNEVLQEGGFRFPVFYPPIGNQVQAVANEYDTPEEAMEYLARNFQHRELVLGEGEFFERQTQLGVGYYKDDGDNSHFVVFFAEPHTTPKMVIKQTFEPPKMVSAENCGRAWRSSSNAEFRNACREKWLEAREKEKEKEN